MLRVIKTLLLDLIIVSFLLFAVAFIYWVLGAITPALAQEPAKPDWYQACLPYHRDFAAWAECVDQQHPRPEQPTFGTVDAQAFYDWVAGLYPTTSFAPDGASWMEHYFARDTNARRTEAYAACLEKARNRRSCRR